MADVGGIGVGLGPGALVVGVPAGMAVWVVVVETPWFDSTDEPAFERPDFAEGAD